MKKNIFLSDNIFELELGNSLPKIEIAYHTSGLLNKSKSNVVWICHALTANSDPEDWWSNLVGKGKLYDPDKYFIICANVIGSCYGSTGPASVNPETGVPYYRNFPLITVRDIIKAHNLLRNELKIDKIHTVIGGSLGGQQALEWSIENSDLFEHTILIATNAVQSPWAIALNESQRMAIEADYTYYYNTRDGGTLGLKAARSIALLSYRNYHTYNSTQGESDCNKTDNYAASTYQQYQGEKLVRRFNAYSYYALSKTVDTHNVGRNRGSIKEALGSISSKTLVISIDTDLLFPPNEQRFLAKYIKHSTYKKVRSRYGHDGFLIEGNKIKSIIDKFYNNKQ